MRHFQYPLWLEIQGIHKTYPRGTRNSVQYLLMILSTRDGSEGGAGRARAPPYFYRFQLEVQ